MRLRYIVDIDIDIDIDIDEEDTEMEFRLRDDICDFVRNHEYGYMANNVNVKLQDEFCIKRSKNNG